MTGPTRSGRRADTGLNNGIMTRTVREDDLLTLEDGEAREVEKVEEGLWGKRVRCRIRSGRLLGAPAHTHRAAVGGVGTDTTPPAERRYSTRSLYTPQDVALVGGRMCGRGLDAGRRTLMVKCRASDVRWWRRPMDRSQRGISPGIGSPRIAPGFPHECEHAHTRPSGEAFIA